MSTEHPSPDLASGGVPSGLDQCPTVLIAGRLDLEVQPMDLAVLVRVVVQHFASSGVELCIHEHHGGSIDVQSTPGQGAVLSFELPTLRKPTAA